MELHNKQVPEAVVSADIKPKGRIFGFVDGDVQPDENRFHRHPCRIAGGEQHLPCDYGKTIGGEGTSSFAYLVQRISDRNYAMRGLCIDGGAYDYVSFLFILIKLEDSKLFLFMHL